MKAGRLNDQVERLMDESRGAYADVIVQFKSEKDDRLSRLLEVVVETERSRSMLTDPSKMLPPEARAFGKSATAKRLLRQHGTSFSANMALGLPASQAMIHPAAVPSAQMGAFLQSAEVRSAVAGARSRLKKQAKRAKPQELPNIDGVRVMVPRGDLPKVIEDQADTIEGVYANAHIDTPRLVPQEISGAGEPAGTYWGTTWGLEHTKALATWSTFETRGQRYNGEAIRVAVLDTGVDAKHPDLRDKVVDFAELDRSGNIIKRGLSNARDSAKHGTHVAGTIVGGDADGGWIGMAPDAELVCGLVLNGSRGGTLAQVIGGINWAADQNAHVINLSLGGLTFDAQVGTPYQRAIVNALIRGCLVVAAIGNDGHQTTGAPGNDYFSLAVAAHDDKQRTAGFSGGRTHVLDQSDYIKPEYLPLVYTKPDLSAPGVAVKSSIPGRKWEWFNGTSMATPHVAGAAALLFAATDIADQPLNQRAFFAKDLLLGGVTDCGESGQDQRFGYGALNVLKSIDAALELGY